MRGRAISRVTNQKPRGALLGRITALLRGERLTTNLVALPTGELVLSQDTGGRVHYVTLSKRDADRLVSLTPAVRGLAADRGHVQKLELQDERFR